MTGRTTVKKSTAQRAIDSIIKGDCDDELVDVLNAINKRATMASVARRWRVNFDGVTLSEDDLTLDEAVAIEKAVDTTWAMINPLSTAAHCRAILRVMLTTRGGLTEDAADERLGKATVAEVMDALELYGVTPAPFDSASAPTT